MRRRSAKAAPLTLVALAIFAPLADAGAAGRDPAERGLDVFVHAATTVVAGDLATLDLIAYGFPSVTVAKALPSATIIAAWDPESLGPGVASAPADVTVTTDVLGHARLDVPVPAGDARKLALLVSLRHGEHVRTRTIGITRAPREAIELRVADTRVVPGSTMPSWITVTDVRTGRAVSGASVAVALHEGEVARAVETVTTDASGMARSSFFVPINATGSPPLSLHAWLSKGMPKATAVRTSVPLSLREELPATPRMLVKWTELQLKPGEVGHAELRVLDAADEPIAGQRVVYWAGPRGTTPPTSDEDWAKNGTVASTDGLGVIAIASKAPRVVTSLGSELTLVARTEIEGQKIEQRRTLAVGQPVASATLSLESEALVPGIEQRAYLRVSDGEHGVSGEFLVEADGLRAKVATDAHGYGALSWTVPEDVGATRDVGPCAGGVAAAVVVRQAHAIPALARHPEPFELCVSVARERASILRTSVQIARVGEKIKAAIERSKRAARGPGSVVLTTPEGFGATFWTQGDEAEIDLANATPGLHEITVAVPQAEKEAEMSASRVLVLPRVLPKLASRLAGGRLAPGGVAEIDVALDDGHGAPIVGTVAAVVIDKEGGGSIAGLERLDARVDLCDQAGAPRDRCDAFLEGDASAETMRRETLTTKRPAPLAPLLDPAAHTKATLNKTFSAVLHSLEGAVFQSETPESLRDVRRKESGRWSFNPELMTLVTAAMSEAPTTPGGEPFGLADLLAVDPQVTFDNVARRITRLKLFNVLSAVRSFKQSEQIDADEPVLGDPNALLRRLVRDGTLTQEGLLDPWGGTIQFVRTNGPPIPFLTVTRGHALHAPGPDGRIGTGDDVKDPFERVVRTTSPYAVAMGEDEIVDARWNMRVGEATVTGWHDMFARLTGTTLGHGEGTGTGQGFGSGHGRLGGSHVTRPPSLRAGHGVATETARWTEPLRTDANGRARLRIPLGDYETTWRVALLARSDAGQSAVSVVDVPVFLPISARIDVGRKLTRGDEISARVLVRNRTNAPRRASLEISGEGGLTVAARQPRTVSVDVPANALRHVFVRFVATAEGQGKALVTLRAPGTDGDQTSQEITIDPPGELRVLAASAAIAQGGAIHVDMPPSYAPRGTARLVVESGVDEALLAALASVEPEPTMPPDTLADAIEIAARIEKVAEANGQHWLVARTRRVAVFAEAYLAEHARQGGAKGEASPFTRLAIDRARLFAHDASEASAPTKKRKAKDDDDVCPKDVPADVLPIALQIEAEPAPSANGPLPCFSALISKLEAKTSLDRARAVLALFDRPHRTPLATNIANELANSTRVATLGVPAFDGTRAERVIVLAALARSAHTWARVDSRARATNPNKARLTLLLEMLALRDGRGGFGTSEATRDAVRALVTFERPAPETRHASRVTVIDGTKRHTLDVVPGGSASVALGALTTDVTIEVDGAPVLARLERPALRAFAAAPDTTITPVAVAVDWPNDAKVGTTGVAHVSYKVALGRSVSVWTRLPLPPGVELAAPVKNATLRQGVVHLRSTVGATETVSLPVRFTLPGKVLIPEAETRTLSEEQPRALTPARMLVVH